MGESGVPELGTTAYAGPEDRVSRDLPSDRSATPQSSIVNSGPSDQTSPKKKICCACPETKQARDECIVMNGEDACAALVEAHKGWSQKRSSAWDRVRSGISPNDAVKQVVHRATETRILAVHLSRAGYCSSIVVGEAVTVGYGHKLLSVEGRATTRLEIVRLHYRQAL